ncbi:SDR family NAD(P)-dependent oxidoreductase [Paenibacillus sp. FSL R7-0313]|uniref:SDR family NAD(P)-dependent oxidoreductase n=1 Tax=Paenibacillus sp. FSL R7-0313 TaxID=2954532 RepID=UPI0030DB557E
MPLLIVFLFVQVEVVYHLVLDRDAGVVHKDIELAEFSNGEYERRNFETNVFRTFNVVSRALSQQRQQRTGHIINFSTAGFFDFGGSSIYAATKFAVDGMSEALAEVVQPFGIHVSQVISALTFFQRVRSV